MSHSFAYLFERFPSFVQTFVYREAEEMVRQEMNPLLVSIRKPDDPAELAEEIQSEVLYLPEEKALRAEVDRRRESKALPRSVRRAISRHRSERDSQRLFEAVWLAPVLKKFGIRHVHAHFGGMAARTAWWLRKLYGFDYSFTGHANDIFCENDVPVTNAELVRGAKFVVTETDYARRWMEEKYPWASGRVFRVFNGIAVDGFPPREPKSAAPRILSVGRYVEKKGFRDLIEACRILRDRGTAFECDIIGGGPLEVELAVQIRRASLESCVRLAGPKPQTEVRRQLARADLFVLACVPEADGGSDNLPTVIMEAMAAGTPVVSTRIAGVPEMIATGENGLLVEPGAPAALADAIALLLADGAFADQLARSGSDTARSAFAIANTTRELKRLLVERADVTVPVRAMERDPALRPPSWIERLLLRFR